MSAILTIDQAPSFAISETGEVIQKLAIAKKAGAEVAPSISISRTAVRQILDDNPKLSPFIASISSTNDPVKRRVAEEQLVHLLKYIKFSEKFIAEITRLYQDYLGGSFVRILPADTENILGDANLFESLKTTWAEQVTQRFESHHSHFLTSLTEPILIQTQLQATASGSITATEIKARLGVKGNKPDLDTEIDKYFFSKSSEAEVSSEIGVKKRFFQRSSDSVVQKKSPKKLQSSRVIDKKTVKKLIELFRAVQRKTLTPIQVFWEQDKTQLLITDVRENENLSTTKKTTKSKITKELNIIEEWPGQICQDCSTLHDAVHAANNKNEKNQDSSRRWLQVNTPALLIDLHEVIRPYFSGAIIDLEKIAERLGDHGPNFLTTIKLFRSSMESISLDELKKAKPILLKLHRPNKHLISLIYSQELLGALCSESDYEMVANMFDELEQ